VCSKSKEENYKKKNGASSTILLFHELYGEEEQVQLMMEWATSGGWSPRPPGTA
jgi:hypothetical protein